MDERLLELMTTKPCPYKGLGCRDEDQCAKMNLGEAGGATCGFYHYMVYLDKNF